MKVVDLCRRTVVSISAAAPVIEAAGLMCAQGIGAVIVPASPADSLSAVGVLTDRDIVSAQVAGPRDPGELRGVRRAPVAGPGGVRTGVISFDDVLAHLAANVAAFARLTGKPSLCGDG